MVEYTKRRNKNRGYMKLDVWHKSIELYKLVCRIVYIEKRIEFKIRAQIADAAQSVPGNIAEGYCRRSINEYIQYLYIAAGSLGETLSRIISSQAADQITKDQFERVDILHYEVENKLLHLIESLEEKRDKGEWITRVSDDFGEYFTK